MFLQARIWYRQRKPEEATAEALRDLEILGVTDIFEGCNTQGATESQSPHTDHIPVCREHLETIRCTVFVNSLQLVRRVRPAPWQIFLNAPTAGLGASSTVEYNILPFPQGFSILLICFSVTANCCIYCSTACHRTLSHSLSSKCTSPHVFPDVFYIPLSPFRRGVESGRSHSLMRAL